MDFYIDMFFKVEYPLDSKVYWSYHDFLALTNVQTIFMFEDSTKSFLRNLIGAN